MAVIFAGLINLFISKQVCQGEAGRLTYFLNCVKCSNLNLDWQQSDL